MRKRLTVTFVLLTVCLCAAAFALRSLTLLSSLNDEESNEVHVVATGVAAAVQARTAAGLPLTEDFLRTFIEDDQMVRVHAREAARDVVARGSDFSGAADPSRSDDTWAAAEVPGGYVMVSQARSVVLDIVFSRPWTIVLFFVALALAAGLAGYLIARALVAPFGQLARAAGALGRGRFDLDLPESRIPEVQAIGGALRTSATQLQDRISQEQSFAEHASHVLRTPLTSLRLELDDLALSDGIPDDVRDAVGRCVERIDSLDVVAGELVQLARRSSLVAGAEIPLRDLAGTCARRWADELAHHDRALASSVAGDLDITYTPGPIEHIHELLLVDVLHRSRGDVCLTYEATPEGALKIRIVTTHAARTRGHVREPGSTFLRARAVVTALGGRLDGDQFADGVDLLLPRR